MTYKTQPEPAVWSLYLAQQRDGETNTTYIVDDATNSKKWCRASTYGGKLSENITQAICRDILAEAILRVETAGFPVVLTIHDELIVEGEFSEADRARFQEFMVQSPIWADGFPIAAECWLNPRYIK